LKFVEQRPGLSTPSVTVAVMPPLMTALTPVAGGG
jgi:hypothetical protein